MMTTVQSPSTVEDIQNWLVDQFAQQLESCGHF
jgi:hypothetical protein